ncbi:MULTISPECIES: DUF3168 domain-containing protein [Protofrankia]|uniref:DUF3168 domain-containing protein n=1 Tax=Protofrankia coriariae TaxID=1562887 RepID=A0ABR5F4C8_9ACTN|nr:MULTISPECIES: DUF3168 domain-containing protein [Protofrankia]KLL11579.1 hypothetical protein FrCorBMG51_11125 [Protofrankia coriariae]ONH35714.1 hypothetical protein BL254_10520 [Protofrankia sp. BMG5.30]
MITGVFDDVPEGQEFPYVTLGDAVETPDNDHGGFGRESVMDIHVWTRERGHSQGADIANQIIRLLDHQALLIDGWRHIVTRYLRQQAMRDPDPEIRHRVLQFLVITAQE